MAVWTYEDVIPTLIPNTIMQKVLKDGIHQVYTVKAISGYVLHDKGRDWVNMNPDTMEETWYRGYTRAEASCGRNYDFSTAQIEIDDGSIVTAYGSREFFAIPENDVPENCIFGSGNNHEIM